MKSLEPIGKKEKLYVKIAQQINNAIESDMYKPGDKLPTERELASQLNVSRASIREALAVLEIMNVIDVKVGDGSYVKQRTSNFQFETKDSSVFELIEVRMYIESVIVKLAIERATEQNIKAIEATNEGLRQTIKNQERIDDFFRYGVAFHKKLAEATQNDVLIQIANSLFEQDAHPLWRHLNMKVLLSYEAREHQLHEHEGILAAIKTKDQKKAEELMKHHIEHLKNMFYE
ncbi:GntR family uxuAB operon transcriptional repressor [Planomicrobium soli]|uniref:GntR family uxuAB operon transcriptional repressor n=1 Tax=Planomicrobium soli TaxID=1176648 RepID=A0A2P8H3D5_9BACL|nr:FadR/GntR family transcriptional regulator [Planomicrobium soli]PSL40717.1 GntR family uxuAB operon transcriptional repressor [Planomicrobium soli]